MRDKNSLIADTLHGSIMLSEFEKDAMVTTLFNRLHDIYQNSTAYLTFPANRTKRMEHSLGCMYLCGNIFYSSICNTEEQLMGDFFEQAKNEFQDILNKLNKREYGHKYEQKLGEAFNKSMREYQELKVEGGIYNYFTPANISSEEYKKIYGILFEGIRIAALLHDIGHPPYSHISENALNYLHKNVSHKAKKNDKETIFLEILDGLVGENHQLHEEMGYKIAELLLMDAIRNITEDEAKEKSIYQKQLYRILVKEVALNVLKEQNTFFKDMHGVIDGTLDGDRLDYVSRDPGNSGFKLGMTEYDRLIYKMKLCRKQEHYLFCPNASVVKTVEDFLMRRWNLYKNIIFHHRVIKTDYLLQNVIIKIAEEYFETDLEDEEHSESYILPYNLSGLWKANKELPANKEISYAISQWNDAWLLTVLKKSYFETYINKNNYLHDQLEEFLTNKKNYFSLVKRKEDFQEIDINVSQSIFDRKCELEEAIQGIKSQAKNNKEVEGPQFDIEGYLSGVAEIIRFAESAGNRSATEYGGFILCTIKRNLFGVEPFSMILDQMMEELGFKQGELFYAEKEPKIGTAKDLYFYQQTDNELVSLEKLSNISNVLKEDLKYSPFFFIYINKKSPHNISSYEMRDKIGKSIGNNIVNCVLDKIKQFISV